MFTVLFIVTRRTCLKTGEVTQEMFVLASIKLPEFVLVELLQKQISFVYSVQTLRVKHVFGEPESVLSEFRGIFV